MKKRPDHIDLIAILVVVTITVIVCLLMSARYR